MADALRTLRENNISTTHLRQRPRHFALPRQLHPHPLLLRLGLLTSSVLRCRISTRARSQVAHGETVRETANMISFMADVIGIRDDMYIGKGNAYMHQIVDAVNEGY